MKGRDVPEIVSVDHSPHAVVVVFKGDEKPTIFPATLLFAAKDIADIMHEQAQQELEDATVADHSLEG